MTEDLDFYDLLDVPSDASQDDIKQAFREQVRVYHPDLNDDDRARAQFTALKKAYDILGDPVERQAYDRLGHANYVAKRTSGLPSPDVWRSSAEKSESTATAETDASETASTGAAGASAYGSAPTGTASGSTTRSRSDRNTDGSGATTATAGASATATAGTGGDSAARTRPTAGGDGNAFVRWWHRQNFAWPLIWLSILTYVAGLVQFGLENAAALEALAGDVAAVGPEPAAQWDLLSSGRSGVDSVVGFLAGTELVAPPLPPTEWYGVLAGIVALPVLGLLAARIGWRADTWGAVSIDETLVLAVALAIAATLLAGPLLAGVVLMPLLFGVVVHRTRQLPGWSPSYLYVCAVFVPALALLTGVAGYASLPLDLLAFVVIPLVGALGLPLRVQIRKRFGR